jgi:hypothetical protein
MQFVFKGLLVGFFAGAASAVSAGAAWLYIAALGLSVWLIERYIWTRTQ